ncbi:MAG: tungsten cofactor oxidoreductase radical SAM maturase [Candidatus Odinarchaeia archaeon]
MVTETEILEKIEEKKKLSPINKVIVIDKKDELIIKALTLDLRKVYVEITNKCNLNCKMCVRKSWSDSLSEMSFKTYSKLIEQLQEVSSIKEFVFGGLGEPTFHPKFSEMVKLIKQKLPGVKLILTTNGTKLDELKDIITNNFDYIIVSIDAVDSGTLSGIRGGAAAGVIENIRRFVQYKRKLGKVLPVIWAEFVAMKGNIDELPKLLRRAKDLDIKKILVTNMLPYTKEMSKESLFPYSDPEEIYKRAPLGSHLKYFVEIDLPDTRLRTERRCEFIRNNSCVIGVTGDTYPCYNFAHEYYCYINGFKKKIYPYSFGNINDKPLKEIWMSEEYTRFRMKVLNFEFPSCVDCSTRDGCDFAKTNMLDCIGNTPSCAECLWSRDIIRCV